MPPCHTLARLILAAAFLAAGGLHLLVPGPFLVITPSRVPFAPVVITLTGVAELAGAVGLMIPRLLLQPVIVWSALWASQVVDWPFRRHWTTLGVRVSVHLQPEVHRCLSPRSCQPSSWDSGRRSPSRPRRSRPFPMSRSQAARRRRPCAISSAGLPLPPGDAGWPSGATGCAPASPTCPRDAAQAIVDRITDVAADLGVETGEPGCDPNLVVIFTDDGRGLAQAMVEQDEDVFHRNVSGLDRGTAALRDFRTADRPVRWWSLSVPVDSETGQRAVRVPGDFVGGSENRGVAEQLGCSPGDCSLDFAPIIEVRSASRLRTQIIDNMYKTIIIVDVDQIGERTTAELGDYLAFVGLAQVDPGADTAGFDTVLNLFDGPSQGLTDWDRSYLQALYAPNYQRVTPGAQATAVADIMTRDRRDQARRPE